MQIKFFYIMHEKRIWMQIDAFRISNFAVIILDEKYK